jgi:putative mRNA 3-end processing factor
MGRSKLIEFHPEGIYCPRADVFIDPWKPQKKAIITHAHADHARWGMQAYLAHKDSEEVLKLRLGQDIRLETVDYGQEKQINGVKFSLHPAGHIYGSAQVRVEYKGEVWVASGDYKTENDGLCAPFEPVRCDHFITESTFGMPVYQWQSQKAIFDEVNAWWRKNKSEGKNTVLFGYSLGKAQRIIDNLDLSIGEVFLHGAIYNTNEALIKNGAPLPHLEYAGKEIPKERFKGCMVIAPPSAGNSTWMRRFQPYAKGVCSGWMMIRGAKRRRAADRGFVLSDHADWNGLNEAVAATGAENIYVTHGYTAVYSRWLREQGLNAQEVQTLYEGESLDSKSEDKTAVIS